MTLGHFCTVSTFACTLALVGCGRISLAGDAGSNLDAPADGTDTAETHDAADMPDIEDSLDTEAEPDVVEDPDAIDAEGEEAWGCTDPDGDGLTRVWVSDRLEECGTSRDLLALAWSGSSYLLACAISSYFNTNLVTLAPDGDRLAIAVLDEVEAEAAMAWTGSALGFSWIAGNELHYALHGTDGGEIVEDVVLESDDHVENWGHSMAWTGSEMHVVWTFDRIPGDGPGYEYRLTRVDAMGHRIGSDVSLLEGDMLRENEHPSLAWTGSRMGVAWSSKAAHVFWDWDGSEVLLASFDPGAAVMGDFVDVSACEGESRNPYIAWGGDRYGVAFHDDRESDMDILFARLDGAGIPMGEATTLTASGFMVGDRIFDVWTGSEFVVGWTEDHFSYAEIVLARIDPDGALAGEFSRIETVEWQSRLRSMVWTGSEIGIAMNDGMYENEGVYVAGIGYCE